MNEINEMDLSKMKQELEAKALRKAQLEGELKGIMREIKDKFEVANIEDLESLIASKETKLNKMQGDFESNLEILQAMDIWK